MPSIGNDAGRQRPVARWLAPPVSPEIALRLASDLGIHSLLAAVLINRGFFEAALAREFLYPELNKLHDPFLMCGMEAAVARIREAIGRREPILIYGDYDVDGTCSIVVLKKAIEILGGLADFQVPHRLKDGYGMRSEAVGRAEETGIRLIVSVDTGIRANEVVRYANALGIDVIITDHHLPEADLPPALAVLNPNRPGCGYPNKNLCGAGVALKLVQALLFASGMPEPRQRALLDSFLKPVAIATVADIVPLTGENRVIVKRGLSGLRQVKNPGLRALLDVAGLDAGESPSAHQVAFRLAPRINAAGRMATAKDVIELFLTDSADRAQLLAEQLDQLNRERQRVETEIVEAILKECEQSGSPEECAGMVFASSGWHLGVLGIVASRLVERFGRPVFVLSEAAENDEDGLPYFSGSGRSIPAFHVLEALESMPELFKRFGGHRQAAGVSLRSRYVEDFRRRFDLYAANRLTPEDFQPEFRIDAEADFAQLTDECASQMLSVGPFGFGNPAPVLCCSRVKVAGLPRLLGSGKHLSVPLQQNGRTLFCKAWNFGERLAMFEPGKLIDVLLQIEDDPFSRKRGYGSWCVSLKDARVSENEATASAFTSS